MLTYNIQNNKALTLTELLVATVAVSIVMLGVVSVDRALRQSQRGTSRNALVSMKTSALMLSITKEAQQATGSGDNISDPGIVTIDADSNLSFETACIRIDTPGTVMDTSDDTWTCYSHDAGLNIRRCTGGGAAATCAAGTIIGQAVSLAFVMEDTAGGTGSGDFYLEIAITNRFDPVAAENPHDNPEFTLQARVNPGYGSSLQ